VFIRIFTFAVRQIDNNFVFIKQLQFYFVPLIADIWFFRWLFNDDVTIIELVNEKRGCGHSRSTNFEVQNCFYEI
jgi:hypothetical protein